MAYCRSLLHRYYTPFYYYPQGTGQEEQHLVSLHTNKYPTYRLFLLSLGPEHTICRENLKVLSVLFERKTEEIKGKKKNGALKIRLNEPICRVNCEGNRSFLLRSGVFGRIIETNERLSTQPELIKQPGDGFICIVQTRLEKVQGEVQRLEKASADLAYARRD